MTNQEAIEKIKRVRGLYAYESDYGAFDMAISALQAQLTCNKLQQVATDTISRQAAIVAVEKESQVDGAYGYMDTKSIVDLLNDLPSVQPEVIRCKDCKHSEFWYRDKRRCFLWHEEGIDVFEDGFCNYAERRTDE